MSNSKWYTKPWALVVVGVVGGIFAMGIIGAAGDSEASEQPAAQEAPATTGEAAEETAAPAAAVEPAVEEQPAPAAATNEKDSLAYKDAVQDAQANIVELREDISDMEHDLNKGSVGWAGMNMTEITFNVSQLEVEEVPPSIADQWNTLAANLTTANDALVSAYEADSVSQMQAALNSMSSTLDKMESLLATW